MDKEISTLKKYIIVTADTNDADYITKQTEISDEQIELIKPVIEAIKNFRSYKGNEYHPGHFITHNSNFPVDEICDKETGEKSSNKLYGHISGFKEFENLVPYFEDGIHRIDSIEVLTVIKEEKLL